MYNIDSLQEYAKKYQGKCLSDKYMSNSTVYKWKCKNNHEFEKTWTTLLRKNSNFCMKCKNNIIDDPDVIDIFNDIFLNITRPIYLAYIIFLI